MWLGQYFQGSFIPLSVQCRASGDAVVAPAAAPTVTIFDSSFETARTAVAMPPRSPSDLPGYFTLPFFLDEDMTTGRYTAVYKWNDGSNDMAAIDQFEVIGGWTNAGKGGYIGLEYYERPNGNFLVGVDERHEISFRKNPKVTA